MKASELIKRLQELVVKYGDNYVLCDEQKVDAAFMTTFKDKKTKQQFFAVDLIVK